MSTQQSFQLAVGASLIAASLPAGQIAGITIDNPSGSWLQLFPTRDLIPPFTVGYARSFLPTISSIDIRVDAAPTYGVVFSTLVGTSPIVTIYSEPVGFSPGVPLNQNAPKRFASATFRTIGNAAAAQNLMAVRVSGGNNVVIFVRRIRLSVANTALLAAAVPMIARAGRFIRSAGGTVLAQSILNLNTGGASPSVVAYGATASDGGALTPITVISGDTQRQAFVPLHETAAGYYSNDPIDLQTQTDAPIICSSVGGFTTGIGVTIVGAAGSNPETNHYLVEMEWEEYS